jgi:hypothetical protein
MEHAYVAVRPSWPRTVSISSSLEPEASKKEGTR